MSENRKDPMELLYRFIEDGEGGWRKEPFPLEELRNKRRAEIDEDGG